MIVIFIRVLVLAIIVTFSMKIMGKRQIGQLQPIDLVIAIMISEVSSIPMQDTSIPLMHGIIPVLALLSLQLIVSYFAKRNTTFRKIVTGSPTLMVHNGLIQIDNLKKELFSVTDLMEHLRSQGWHDLSNIHTAILEPNGLVSVIPKSQFRPADASMLNAPSPGEGSAYVVVEEGRISDEGLALANKNKDWLMQELKKNKIASVKNVYFASISPDSTLFWQLNNQSALEFSKKGKV